MHSRIALLDRGGYPTLGAGGLPSSYVTSATQDQLDAEQAYQRQMSLEEYRRIRDEVEQRRAASSDIEYRNGVMFKDGERATPRQVLDEDRSNPYKSENWLREDWRERSADPLYRGPEESIVDALPSEIIRDKMTSFQPTRQQPRLRGARPPKAITVEKETVSVTPAVDGKVDVGEITKPFGKLFSSMNGPLSKSAKIRGT